jgi:dUTP pyrophosphatase
LNFQTKSRLLCPDSALLKINQREIYLKIYCKKLSGTAQLPKYGRDGDAGLDLHSNQSAVLDPNSRQLIKTGIAMAIPKGYVGLVWDRGGMAAKKGITTMAGVVDSNYRGEVGVVLLNTTNEPYVITAGDRIAQMLIQPVVNAVLEQVEELDETNRGAGAYGSSGK